MSREEIHRKLFVMAKLEELTDPDASPLHRAEVFEMTGDGFLSGLLLTGKAVVRNEVAGGGTTHSEGGVNRFDGGHRGPIELEILAPRRIEEEPKVRFIPNFKVPLPDFMDSIALDEMAHQLLDQQRPLVVVLGWCDVRLPPEAAKLRLAG